MEKREEEGGLLILIGIQDALNSSSSRRRRKRKLERVPTEEAEELALGQNDVSGIQHYFFIYI